VAVYFGGLVSCLFGSCFLLLRGYGVGSGGDCGNMLMVGVVG